MRCVILLGLASCFPFGSTTPKTDGPPVLDQTFGSYVAVLRHEDAGYPLGDGTRSGQGMYIGQLQSFELGVDVAELGNEAYDASARSAPDMADLSLYYVGIADGRICFDDSVRGAKTYDSADDFAGYDLALHIAIEAHDDLAAIASRPLQPSPGSVLDTFEVTTDEVVDKDTDYGTIERERRIHWRLCGPAPEITAQTRYVTATFRNSDGKDGLLIWELAGANAGQ